MRRFQNQLLRADNTWKTRYNIPKTDKYRNSSTNWTLVSLKITVEKYGTKVIFDQTGRALAGMCLRNFIKTHSV